MVAKRFWTISCLLLLLVLSASCAPKGRGGGAARQIAPEDLPRSVAILPFSNETASPEAATNVRRMFYNFFSSLNYLDQELFEVDTKLKNAGLYHQLLYGSPVDPKRIGAVLGVDAVVFGEVTHYGKIYALLYSEVQAGLKAKMVDCRSGQTIWEDEYVSHMREGGVSISPLGLASNAARALINLRQEMQMRAVSDLCMNLTSTIPNPPRIFPPGPAIKVFVHNGAQRLFLPGERIKVALVGEPGCRATWDISPLRTGLVMKERRPGLYIGEYRVKKADKLAYGSLVAHLISPAGQERRWFDVLGPVALGRPSRLPQTLRKSTVITKDKSPYLIRGALMVPKGRTLTIEPGATVWIDGMGIIVQGSIHAGANRTEPARFLAQQGTRWKGIILDRSKADNRLRGIELTGARCGIRAKGSRLSIADSTISDCTWGIVLENSTAAVRKTIVKDCEKSGIAAADSRLTVSASTIQGNAQGGILIKGGEARLRNSNICSNGKWNLKILQSASVDAAENWWGATEEEKLGIIGEAKVRPVLKRAVRIFRLKE